MMLVRITIVLILISFTSTMQSNPLQKSAAINNSDVISLLQTGLSPEVVIAKIKASSTSFATSVAELKELKLAGVPDSVILAIIEASKTNPPDQAALVESPNKLSKIPRVFIDAKQGENVNYDFWNGLHTDNDLNTVSEIARMLSDRGEEDGVSFEVVFDRDKADLIWILGREKKWNSKMYTWNLVDRKTGQAWAYGKENWFRNAVKDTVKFVKITWGMKKVGLEAGELAKKYPVTITLPKKIKKGEHKDNVGRVVVSGTINKTTIRVVSHNPDLATFVEGNDEILINTEGGDSNFAEFKLVGTGKKGSCYFNAFVVAIN